MDNTIRVQVGVMPGRIDPFVLREGSTVREALEAAELLEDADQYTIKVNGQDATQATVLSAGSTVVLSKQVKGN